MRLIAAFFTLITFAATVLAGIEFSTGLAAPTPLSAPVLVERDSGRSGDQADGFGDQMAWPALFGMPEPPKPPEPVVELQPPAPPTPPKPPKPPLASLGYQLKGVVRAGDAVWGLVSHPTGDQIMRVGDALTDGVMIAQIDEKGLWVSRDDDAPELLGFEE